MIKNTEFTRYIHLIGSIHNWYSYLLNKFLKKDPITFQTRKRKLQFQVPSDVRAIFKEIFMENLYDIERIKKVTNSSSIVFDIGANAGYFTLFMAEKIFPKEIHCFEPFLTNFTLLESNVSSINQKHKVVFLNNCAMVAPGKQEINLFIQEQGEHSSIPSIIKDFNTSQLILKVKATNLEKYCSENKIEQIDLLKMDCEGAEYEIFYNLSEQTFHKIQHIYMETHDLDLQNNNTNALVKHFEQFGYQVEILPLNDDTAMVWATRNPKTSH